MVKARRQQAPADMREVPAVPRRRFLSWLPGQAVHSPPLGVFKTQLGKALSSLVGSHSGPCLEQEPGPETS